MQPTALLRDRTALSPVVGIVVVVAFTVLAVGLGGTVLVELAEERSQPDPPNTAVAFEYDYPGHTLTIRHAGGDALRADAIEIRDTLSDGRHHDMRLDRDGTFGHGDVLVDAQPYDRGETIRVVWTSEDGTATATLGTSNVPGTRYTPGT